MRKQILSVVLILCALLGLTACADNNAPTETAEVVRPADWDAEAMRPYVVSSVSDKKLEQVVAENNQIIDEFLADSPDYRDYPYDSIEATLLDTCNGWVKN